MNLVEFHVAHEFCAGTNFCVHEDVPAQHEQKETSQCYRNTSRFNKNCLITVIVELSIICRFITMPDLSPLLDYAKRKDFPLSFFRSLTCNQNNSHIGVNCYYVKCEL